MNNVSYNNLAKWRESGRRRMKLNISAINNKLFGIIKMEIHLSKRFVKYI